MDFSDAGIFGALLVVLGAALAAGARLARGARESAPARLAPPPAPQHDGGASAVIVEESARVGEQIEEAATTPSDAATLARLRRGRR